MSNYTSDSDNIYFLNDKNIANGVDDECPAGFNAVPSQDAFVGKYKELSARDKELNDYIQNNIETSCASISSRLTAFEAAAAADYLKTTGGEISGGLTIQRTLSVGETLVVEGRVSSKYVQTGDDGSITFTAPDKHGKIVFDFEHGVEDIVVNGGGETLYSFVQHETESAAEAAKTAAEKHSDDNREAAKKYADDQIGSRIGSLDYTGVAAGDGKMIGSISQTDGVVGATIREITSADIPMLPEAKIENLTAKYATKSDVENEYVKAKNLDFYYNKNNDNCIWLVDKDHDVSLSVDCAGFVKDGMISSVKMLDEGAGYSKENGPYLVITWNTDADVDQTWIKIRDFFKVCTSTDENGGLSVADYKIWLNYDVVAKTADVKPIKDYVDSLSAPAVGAIDVLRSGISALNVQNVRQMKFDGHIKHAEKSLKEIIKANSDTAVEDLVRNNSMFDVMFTDAELSAPSASYETEDGFTLGNGDVVVIHDCNAKQESIGIDDLNKDNVRILKGGVARYELEAEKKTRSDCDTFLSGLVDQVLSGAVKLSGDNEISGDNQFVNGTLRISSAMVSDALSVDFGKLIDSASTSSAVEICAYLSNAISNHIKNNNNPHNVTAPQTSAYLCSETSSAVELSDKFGSLSASLSCDASCTVDEIVQNDGVVSARFKAISIDIDHVAGLKEKVDGYDKLSTYAETSAQLSNDGYATKPDVDAADAVLSAAIDGKVRVDGVSAATLDVRHVDAGDYHSMVKAGTLDENTLYVVSSDTFSAYGEKIVDVATPTNGTDAANKKYVDDEVDGMAKSLSVEDMAGAASKTVTRLTEADGKISAAFESISITTNQVSGLSGKIAMYDKLSTYNEIHGRLSVDGYATNNKIDSSDKYLSSKIDGKVWVGKYVTGTKKYELVSADSLSVVKISSEDYYDLVESENVNPDVLYIVSSDVLNAHGQRIVNVATPISATDAVNLEYMKGATSGIFAKNFAEALKKAESMNAYLTSDSVETLLGGGFTNRHVLSILLDIKRIFTELSSVAAG